MTELHPGSRLGRYEIAEVVGRGAMGEVYRARDPRLGRDVAIKRLSPRITRDVTLRSRFEREARALSQFVHPGICALYDVIDQGSESFLVMEYVEGRTLADRLHDGPLPVNEALQMGAQIARALAAAHQRGLIHRDVKPANIILSGSQAKLLDFGVAKTSASAPDPDATGPEDATLAGDLTVAGSLVGTPRFMSPEQARGDKVDARSDIFSLGATLYTALTGRSPIEATNPGEAVVRLRRFKPPTDYTRKDDETVPLKVREVVARCLSSDPDRRYASAEGVARDLEALTEDEDATLGSLSWSGTPAPADRRRTLALTAVTVILLVALVGLLWQTLLAGRQEARVRRYSINLPQSLQPREGFAYDLALSPDAEQLVYVSSVEGQSRLLLRPLDSLDAEVLPGTAGALQPFFSPDGEHLGFFTMPEGLLKQIATAGGEPETLARVNLPFGGSWGDDGSIVYWGEMGRGLLRLAPGSSTPTEISTLDTAAGEVAHGLPFFLPGSRAVLFNVTRGVGPESYTIEALRIATGERIPLIEGGVRPQYLDNGHLLFARQGELLAVPFDPDRLELRGEPKVIDEPRLVTPDTVPIQYTFADDGTLVYVPAGTATVARRALVWVDRDGQEAPLELPDAPYYFVRLSPDGRTLAVTYDDFQEIELLSLDSGARRWLTDGPLLDLFGVWRPGGEELAFSSNRGGSLQLWLQSLDGNTPARQLTSGPGPDTATSWSPDGRLLLYGARNRDDGSNDLWQLELETGEKRALIATPADEGQGFVSPDGRWLTYLSNRSGGFEVYLAPWPELDRSWQVSQDGGADPLWSPDGRTLYFRTGDAVYETRIGSDGDQPLDGPPRRLFSGRYRHNPARNRPFDIDPAGERLLMIRETAPERGANELIAVEGWLTEAVS